MESSQLRTLIGGSDGNTSAGGRNGMSTPVDGMSTPMNYPASVRRGMSTPLDVTSTPVDVTRTPVCPPFTSARA